MRGTGLFVVALLLVVRTGSPQGTPLGTEFRVNTYTSSLQDHPSVGADGSGNFVITWHSPQDPGYGVFAQRYSASGMPLGSEFHVNTYTTGQQLFADVAADASGNFVVVWMGNQQGPGRAFGQRYASSGTPLGGEFRATTNTSGVEGFPSVAADSSGNFVVVWEGGLAITTYCICGQRFASSGAPLGPEFRVNTYTTGEQYDPSVAVDPAGNFVVVWRAVHDGSNNGVFGQRYASNGAQLGAEFRVNTYTTNSQTTPAVSMDGSGNFVVVWYSQGQDGSGGGIFAQRFANSGAPAGTEFRVNTYTTNSQFRPDVATDGSGNFVVVWSSYQGGSYDEVFGQRYASSGLPLGPEFRVNTNIVDRQHSGTVASSPAGNFVIAWAGGQPGSYDIFGQRYSPIVPVELMELTID